MTFWDSVFVLGGLGLLIFMSLHILSHLVGLGNWTWSIAKVFDTILANQRDIIARLERMERDNERR